MHATIPDNLASWRIWRYGRDLFHLVEVEDYQTMRHNLRDHPANVPWQRRMSELLEVEDRYGVDDSGLPLVWDYRDGDRICPRWADRASGHDLVAGLRAIGQSPPCDHRRWRGRDRRRGVERGHPLLRHGSALRGRTEAILGMVLATAAIVVGGLAIAGVLSGLGTDTNQVERLHDWLPSWLS